MHSEDTLNLRDFFTMFEPVGEDPKRQRFCFRYGFADRCAIGKDARQLRDFGDPAAVDFLFDFHGEVAHSANRSAIARGQSLSVSEHLRLKANVKLRVDIA